MTPADVLSLTCSGFGVTLDALRGPQRSKYLNSARRSAAKSLKELGLSSPEIGPLLGRDPSTIRFLLTVDPNAPSTTDTRTASRP